MGIYNIFIVSKSGGLIYHYDHNLPQKETEKTFSFPLDIHLHLEQNRVSVVFGERDGIRVGHALLSVNGSPGKLLPKYDEPITKCLTLPLTYDVIDILFCIHL